MHRTFLQLALTVALLGLLAGCKQPQSSSPLADNAGEASEATKASATPAGPLYLVPAELGACEPGAVVVVHWDMRKTRPDITDVEIWTGPAGGTQTLFAAGGYAGEASTVQPWGHPGTTFSLRNKADGVEVATATVGGPACGG